MPLADKVYVAVQNGETKIEIRVSKIESGYYMAFMDPVTSDYKRLMSPFKDKDKILLLGNTIEDVIACCKTWIKENLGQDVVVHEKRTI